MIRTAAEHPGTLAPRSTGAYSTRAAPAIAEG
jgi:hypothetical protein